MKCTIGVLLLLIAGILVGLAPAVSTAQDPKLIEAGREVYDTYCIVCHGEKGDGKGLTGIIHRAQKSGMVISIYPRDLTAGMFKFRSTSTGYLPTDDDLLKIVTNGIPRSGMPSHKDLSAEERKAVVEYVKIFSKRWREEKQAGTPIKIGKAPGYVGTEASVERGKVLYLDMVECFKCHGRTGLGDGPSSQDLKDNWGDKSLAFDFTSGPLKGGTTPEDIYRTFVTGLDGTPMPSYEESLNEKQRWDLVSYCLELMKGRKTVAEK